MGSRFAVSSKRILRFLKTGSVKTGPVFYVAWVQTQTNMVKFGSRPCSILIESKWRSISLFNRDFLTVKCSI